MDMDTVKNHLQESLLFTPPAIVREVFANERQEVEAALAQLSAIRDEAWAHIKEWDEGLGDSNRSRVRDYLKGLPDDDEVRLVAINQLYAFNEMLRARHLGLIRSNLDISSNINDHRHHPLRRQLKRMRAIDSSYMSALGEQMERMEEFSDYLKALRDDITRKHVQTFSLAELEAMMASEIQ